MDNYTENVHGVDSITNAYQGEYHAKDLKLETLEAIYKNIVGEE